MYRNVPKLSSHVCLCAVRFFAYIEASKSLPLLVSSAEFELEPFRIEGISITYSFDPVPQNDSSQFEKNIFRTETGAFSLDA